MKRKSDRRKLAEKIARQLFCVDPYRGEYFVEYLMLTNRIVANAGRLDDHGGYSEEAVANIIEMHLSNGRWSNRKQKRRTP